MSAPVASETRSRFRAGSEISACPGGGAEPGGHEQRAGLVAVQGNRVGLVVHRRPPDMRRRRAALLDGVLIEASDGGQPPG
jgi:hypothetical protein